MTNQEIEQNISKFKIDLLRKMPFYGDIVINLTIEADASIPTACTNGLNVKYSPKFFSTLSKGEQNFVIMHEVFHILLRHCQRDNDKNPEIWNVAADLVVNDMLVKLKEDMKANNILFDKPREGLFSEIYNETVENLYAKIYADNAKVAKSGKVKKLSIRKSYTPWRGDQREEISVSSDLQPGKLTPIEKEVLNSVVEELVRKASNVGRSPFGHCRIPDEFFSFEKKSYLNWKKILKNYLDSDRSDESSYTTPERKYIHMDLILPGHEMDDEVLEEVWAFVDSSGSIGTNEMNKFLTELYTISKQFHCVMNICYWDTSVGDVYRNIRTEKALKQCIPHHSGGTDINCVYEWIRNNKVKPGVMLILTDGMYGRVTTENRMPSLKRKTILVISEERFVNQGMKELGKVATLEEDK